VALDTDETLFEADHGSPVKALAAGKAGLAIRPFVEMQDAYAWALHVNGRDAEALRYARLALSTGLRSALFRYHLGMIERALGQTAGARRDLTTALAINPHFSPLLAPRARQALATLTVS
jgi:Flp pilus assembly protein TadD